MKLLKGKKGRLASQSSGQLIATAEFWPYSSFHRQVKLGSYDSDWGAGTEIKFDVKVGYE